MDQEPPKIFKLDTIAINIAKPAKLQWRSRPAPFPAIVITFAPFVRSAVVKSSKSRDSPVSVHLRGWLSRGIKSYGPSERGRIGDYFERGGSVPARKCDYVSYGDRPNHTSQELFIWPPLTETSESIFADRPSLNYLIPVGE